MEYIFEGIRDNIDFTKRIYRFMIKDDTVSGREICSILLEQDLVDVPKEEIEGLEKRIPFRLQLYDGSDQEH